MANFDRETVAGFGDEWKRFDQRALGDAERNELFERYFSIFPWQMLPPKPVGFDLGCGSGRWAALVAPKVDTLHCIDASDEALSVAKANLADRTNCQFVQASVDSLPLAESSMDFGYSLGVLHHVPDTAAGIAACVKLLKRGAPFLLYLYYRFDNRPKWFQALWQFTDLGRRAVSALPRERRQAVTDFIAASVYLPLATTSKWLERLGADVSAVPLSSYRRASFYTMRTDALDRFGTRLEQRFTRDEIRTMMTDAGLERITFSDSVPYWCAIGYRR